MTDEPKITLKIKVDNILQMISNKVTSWSNTPSDDNYPSEKLVKDSLDSKASSTDLTTGLQNIGSYTIHTVYNVSGSASAYNISSGLSYTQQSPVFFLVKNTIGDNQANATLKYYPNGNNITIIDTFSNTSYPNQPIQQGVWKKDTWALFFCYGNSSVQLRCVFYDSVNIDTILNKSESIDVLGTHTSTITNIMTGDANCNSTDFGDGFKISYIVPIDSITSINAYLKLSFKGHNPTNNLPIKSKGQSVPTNKFKKDDIIDLQFDETNGVWNILNHRVGVFSIVATTGSYNDLSNKPTIPSASTSTPNADTTSGSVGTGTTWARSNHTHPKSSLYAEASHTHSEYVNPIIVDNLTTDDATKVLSAKQGKVLNDLIGDAITYINGTGGS